MKKIYHANIDHKKDGWMAILTSEKVDFGERMIPGVKKTIAS